MNKTTKILATSILTLGMLTACSSPANAPTETSTITAPPKSNACDSTTGECETTERGSVKSLVSDNVEILTLKESLDYLDGTAVLFFSFDDCPWCYDAWPVMEQVWHNYNIPLYYVSVERSERVDENKDYQTLLSKVSSEVDGKIYIPFALFLYNGEIIGSNTGTVEGHEFVDNELPLITDEQKSQLTEIYKTLFDEVQSQSELESLK